MNIYLPIAAELPLQLEQTETFVWLDDPSWDFRSLLTLKPQSIIQ